MDFHSVVFAGGGNRCVWQAGLWHVVAPAWDLKPRVIAGVSAGACMAALALAGIGHEGLEFVQAQTRKNPKNFYVANLFHGLPAFPHPEIYPRVLRTLLDQKALERIKAGPELRILLAVPPRGLPPALATMLGFVVYTVEKHTKHPLHPQWATAMGFRPQVLSVSDMNEAEELVQAVLASSCTPPILPPMRMGGHPVLDGGLIDNVPLAALKPGEEPALIMLSRRYDPAQLVGHPGRTYLQPSRPVPVKKWDYTDPVGLQEAWDLGVADGRRLLEEGPQALQR